MRFANREEAARQLADRLTAYRDKHPLVLAIPRGAVPMVKVISDSLEGEFDVVLVRKLGAPGDPEFAIGAIDETGWAYIGPYASLAGAGDSYLAALRARELETIRKRRETYSPLRSPRDPAGRTVIVVDDGLATGATMIAALHTLRAKNPKRLICAVPVAPPETLEDVAKLADEVVCLYAPEDFRSVGQFYADFRQVSDEEVVELLSAQDGGKAESGG